MTGYHGGGQNAIPSPVDDRFQPHPDDAVWVARIEAARLEAAPKVCPTCGSVAEVVATRVCTVCGVAQPITQFVRNKRSAQGRERRCLACKAAQNRLDRARRKRLQFRAILGRAS